MKLNLKWMRDIEQLRKEKEKAELEAERKMEYFANVAHEIRTPINAIMGYDELILREYNDPALRQYASSIRSAANTLLSIINDSLDYSRIEAGKMRLFPEEYDLGAVIEELAEMIRPRAATKGLELKNYVNEQTPRFLYGDSDRLKQCIINLLTNAVKYTEEGEIAFSVDYELLDEISERGNTEILLKISVRDTGIGIKKEDLSRLYSPFERIEEEKNRYVEGTGLGISIVKEILGLMGSKLELESVYGEGSNFHFEVKQEVMKMNPIGDFEQLYAENLVSKDKFYTKLLAPDVKILVVDDAELNLSVMEELLKDTRMQVDSAMSSTTGLELASKRKYDLIFIDLRMPGMNGEEMVSLIRGRENDSKGLKLSRWRRSRLNDSDDGYDDEHPHVNKNTPCIALSSGTLQEMQGNHGFADYLLKPVVYKELEEVLLKYLPKEKVKSIDSSKKDKSAREADSRVEKAAEILRRRQNKEL
ncbi:ATP-binding response regulator [Butyrivibrio sp. WCD3002]|uniref:ATP-binding response regulator n=1 Tax=Butyrivibrio sp. WCD3002 TaxID=1280676 RepID=UPI0003F9B640|nr:ATP-binding protein [Butyrivibrio sp. WCD3002]